MVHAYMMNRLLLPEKGRKKIIQLLYFIFRDSDPGTRFVEGAFVFFLGVFCYIKLLFQSALVMLFGTAVAHIRGFVPFRAGFWLILFTDRIAFVAGTTSVDHPGISTFITETGFITMISMSAVIVYFSSTSNLGNGDVVLDLFCNSGTVFSKFVANRFKRFFLF